MLSLKIWRVFSVIVLRRSGGFSAADYDLQITNQITSYDVSTRYIKHIGHCTCRSGAICGDAEGGVYQELLLCSRCMDDFHHLMIDLKAGEVDLEDLEFFG